MKQIRHNYNAPILLKFLSWFSTLVSIHNARYAYIRSLKERNNHGFENPECRIPASCLHGARTSWIFRRELLVPFPNQVVLRSDLDRNELRREDNYFPQAARESGASRRWIPNATTVPTVYPRALALEPYSQRRWTFGTRLQGLARQGLLAEANGPMDSLIYGRRENEGRKNSGVP